MRNFLFVCIGIVLSIVVNGQSTLADGAPEGPINGMTNAQCGLLYEHLAVFPPNTQVALAVIQNKQPRFVGIERISDTIREIENYQHIFEIGSITKVFTSTLLANFVVDGTLQLDDFIQDYVDFEIKISKNIRFQHLANHTSGLPRLPLNLHLFLANRNNPYQAYNQQKLIEYLTSDISLSNQPGAHYEYSNLGAGLLGFVLAGMSKVSYEELLQEKVFRKYKMVHSTSRREELRAPLVNGLTPGGEITSNWDFDALAGAGAIFSTAEDLSRFAVAHFDARNTELLLTQKPTFRLNENMHIGLGWHIIEQANAGNLIWHNGGTGGYSSSMALDVEKQNGIIILSNVSSFHEKKGNIDLLCFSLLKLLEE